MTLISVEGRDSLSGKIPIQGSKNTVLPIIASSILCEGVTIIYNCPDIVDVHSMVEILEGLGCQIEFSDNTLKIDSTNCNSNNIPSDMTNKLRSSVMLLGPLLGKFNEAYLGYPGGCKIGERPIDIHLEAFGRMNVGTTMSKELITCSTYLLQGAELNLKFASVGATENILMAASLAKGKTVIKNAAKEPEIIELANHLVKMGAEIYGAGTDVITIYGVEKLNSTNYINVCDRIVVGTYMIAASLVESNIELTNVYKTVYLENIIKVVRNLGAEVIVGDGSIFIKGNGKVNQQMITTGPYPMIPTDIQSFLLVAYTKGNGISTITEGVFENRYVIASELEKMGADIEVNNYTATIKPTKLLGAHVYAPDLRGGAALIIAGIIGKGQTTIDNIEYILRGYEDVVGDLQKVGVSIDYIEG